MSRRSSSNTNNNLLLYVDSLLQWRLSFLLIACLVLGGTAQIVMTYKLPLYLISLLIIGQTLSSKTREPIKTLWRPPFIIGAAALIVVMTLSAGRREIKNSQMTIVALATFAALLGLIQTLSGPESFRLYENFTPKFAVGLFSNANHLATFLAMALPLALYLTSRSEKSVGWQNDLKLSQIFAAFATIVIIMGVFLSGSSAGYALLLFALVLTLWIINKGSKMGYTVLIFGVALLLIILIDAFFLSGQLQEVLKKISIETQTSRQVIVETSLAARRDFGFFGSGPGSFADIYYLYEDHDMITPLFVNEAHNDYLQVWFEMGWPGLLILLAGHCVDSVDTCYRRL